MRRPRPRPSGDLDLVDVLLVEDEEDVAADEVRMVLHELALEAMSWRATWPGEPERLSSSEATVPFPEPPGLARRIARRYRRRALTGAVLAVAVAATTAVVDARQTAARAAALAAMPAVLTETSGPPGEVWRVPGRVVSDQDDTLLVVDGTSLQAIDPSTGKVIWTASDAAGRAASTGDCFPVDESLLQGRAPVEDGSRPRGLVACVAQATGGGSPADAATTGAGVVVLDSATGRTRQTVTADGALLLAEPLGGDLLLAAARADGRVRVTRWDLAAGAPRWDTVSGGPVIAAGVVDAVERRPDSLVVAGFAVDLRSGEELDAEAERRRPYPYEEHTLPDGARASWAWQEGGASGRGHVSGGDEGSSYMLPGPPLRPSVTDGSDAGTLVVRTPSGGRLRGLNLRTGRMKWTQPSTGASAQAMALVDGIMLLDEGDTVSARQVRTGDAVWRARVDPDMTDGAALTDGRVVLLPTRADDGALQLAAYRIADGTVEWRTGVPSGTVSVTAVGHELVASTGDTVIGLG